MILSKEQVTEQAEKDAKTFVRCLDLTGTVEHNARHGFREMLRALESEEDEVKNRSELSVVYANAYLATVYSLLLEGKAEIETQLKALKKGMKK